MGTNTGLGIGIGIPFKNNALGGDKPYFPPELKARMIGVWTNYGKKNTDADRNIIKNKIPNAGGDLEILNAAYKLNSGFGEYSEDFTTWTKSSKITSVDSESFDFVTNANWNLLYYKSNIGKDIPSFKVRIKLKGEGKVFYNYITSEGVYTNKVITSEEYLTPISYNTKYTGETPVNCGFTIGITSEECSGTITQIPNFEDAFVSDGINDMIVSQKTLQEMGVTKGLTIVSMIHQINTNERNFITTNNLRNADKVVGRNIVTNIDKTGIYGWYKENIEKENIGVINNILGDKADYVTSSSPSTNTNPITNSRFYVTGYAIENGFAELSSVAHYWTFAVLGKATEDEINLIIAKYNLDRTLRPDILCNITKQGITNDNHADFNDKLVDYSGNGRDIQMNNLAWKGGSGIAAKPFETIKDYAILSDEARQELTIYNEFSYKVKSNTLNHYWIVQSIIKDNTSYQVTIITDKDCYWINSTSFINNEGNKESIRKEYLVKANTPTQVTICGLNEFEYPEDIEPTTAVSYVNLNYAGEVTVTFIPSCKGGLLFDGVNDFGKVTGMPIYKDYTFIIDRKFLNETFANQVCLASKSKVAVEGENGGAFIIDNISTNAIINPYSFYKTTSLPNLNTFDKQIVFQTKYKYLGKDIAAGTATDSDTLWLGTFRDNDSRFANAAIYSLMSFPYSMSEFLIERQLKKHKLGTLYPNMVEFRPVIKSSVELASKPTFVIRGTSTLLNTGDYIPENSEIWVVITMNNAADRITKFVINGNTIDIPSSAYNPSTMKYGFPFTIDSKSPQKITMTIEQDENYVKFEPVITSNVEYVRLDFYLNNYQKRINIGDYIPKDAYLRANLYLKNNVDELTVFTFNGVNIGYRRSSVDDMAFNISQIYNYDSPQEVNITIDEYIRYEDIVQPYPSFVKLENLDRTHTYTWGDKLKVGDIIRYNSSKNLLEGAYTLRGQMECNGVYVFDNNQQIVVTKEMVFAWSHSPIWNIDDNEPKVILSPRLLRIPNSSYKILGHIPDISGHGNHGKINNSAYAKMSGANGYKQDFTSWRTNGSGYSIVTDSKYILTNEKAITNGGYFLWNRLAKDSFKVKISNIPNGGWMSYRYKITEEDTQFSSLFIREDGIYTLPATIADSEVDFFISTVSAPAKDWIGLTIEQIGEYEGAYCLDDVDDFITIPTAVGGKQVLMKVNWDTPNASILYDQRGYNNEFAIYNGANDSDGNPIPAYQGRNNGQTYIDGILNSNIKASELRAITHNITITNELSAGVNKFSPVIGSNRVHNAYFTNMALYDFMLFDNISTDDKIKQLNEYVGIEAKVELPPYYWDTYGKTNLDGDKATIQQRGVAVGDFDLTNNNLAYEGMSGYNGYPVVFGANKTWANESNGYVTSITSNTIHITNVLNAGLALLYSYVKYNGNLQNIKEIPPFKIEIKGLEGRSKFIYKYLATSDATKETDLYLGNGTHELPKSFLPTEALINNAVVGFSISPIEEGVTNFLSDITIEVLPEYENGLVYDGITNYSKNANIPALDDFTAIIKREWLKKQGCPLIKGSKVYDGGNGNALLLEWDKAYNFVFYKRTDIMEGELPDNISFITPTNYNGNVITRGSEQDTNGICIAGDGNAGFANMVFYKLILYPKTIPLLQINFLKNLMERDEIIDLNNPIFIQE